MILIHYLLLGGMATGAFWAWVVAHVAFLGLNDLSWSHYIGYSLLVLFGLAVDAIITRLRGTDLLRLNLSGALKLSLQQSTTTMVALLLFLVASKDAGISRLFLFSFLPLLYALFLLCNVVAPPALAKVLFFSKRRERTLLVGAGGQAAQLLDWCKSKTLYGVDVVGLVTDDFHCPTIGLPMLGRVKSLESLIAEHRITQLIALDGIQADKLEELAGLSERVGVRLLVVRTLEKETLEDEARGDGAAFAEAGFRLIPMRREPLECPFNRLIKKVVDVGLSVPIVMLVLPPVSLAVYLIHRFQSPGPLFFRQQRTGINSRTFWIYKFRTMHVAHGQESRQASANDDRVFKLGQWLRKLSIDELPQFLNVLNGDMSIVGPRPHMLVHTEHFVKLSSGFHVRALVKPGITGLAQVRGFRGETTSKEDVLRRVESDVYYLENWSLWLEWSIILRTIGHVLRPPKTAY